MIVTCFLPSEDLTKGMGGVKSSLLIEERRKNDEVLELPTRDINANSYSEPRSGSNKLNSYLVPLVRRHQIY